MLKKLVTFILCAAIIAGMTCAAFAQNPADSLNVIVATDLHLMTKETVGNIRNSAEMPEYPLYFHAKRNGMLNCESEAVLVELLKRAALSDAEYVLITGDIVNDADHASHKRAAELFRSFEATAGKQIFVINGNHDCRNGFTKDNFRSNYADFGFTQALARHSGSLSYTADLGGDYRLLAIDTCTYDDSRGRIDASLLAWIAEQAEAADKDGKKLVAMMHHGLLEHMKGAMVDVAELFMTDRIEQGDELSNTFADLGIKYFFTGHAHANDITKAYSAAGNEIYDVESVCLISYPCSYRNVSFSDSGIDIKTERINSIDTVNLPAGYTADQLALIKSDFQGYAYGMLAPSTKYVLRGMMTDMEGAFGRFGISAGSEIGKIYSKLMPRAYETICFPIYSKDDTGLGSFEALAGAAGFELPQSEYKTIFDIAAYIIAAHSSGDENIPANSIEIKLFWQCMKLAVMQSMDGFEEDYDTFVQKFPLHMNFTQLKDCVSRAVFRQSLSREILAVLLAPLIEGATVDAYQPGDVNVTLPSYSAQPQEQSKLQRLAEIIDYLRDVFSKLMEIVFGRLKFA